MQKLTEFILSEWYMFTNAVSSHLCSNLGQSLVSKIWNHNVSTPGYVPILDIHIFD